MEFSTKGIDILQQLEGFSSNPYKDEGGVWTIGYGTTKYPNGNSVSAKDEKINSETAKSYLINDVSWAVKTVNFGLKVPVNQSQFDALVIFTYNVGKNAFLGSTLLRLINANKDSLAIKDEFLKWIYVKGKVSNGLLKRRTIEQVLYFS